MAKDTISKATIELAAEPAPISVPRPHSKTERLLTLLRAGTGASLDDMMEATGWQAHTVRAAMTGLRKRGFAISRHVEGSMTVWSATAADVVEQA